MTTYIWSIDDAGSGDKLIESMSRTCAFFDSRGVKSTWFVIPKPNGAALSTGWRAELDKEIAAQHEEQHSDDHHRRQREEHNDRG